MTPSHVAGFFGYFAVLSLVMLPAAVAFVRKKTSRWFLLGAGLLLLIGGTLNWWGLLPTFSWNGYEPDWSPICVGAFLVMMLLAIFGESQPPPQTAKMKFFRHSLGSLLRSACPAGIGCSRLQAHRPCRVRRLIMFTRRRACTSG